MLARPTTPGCLVSLQLPSKGAREGTTPFPKLTREWPPVAKELGYPCGHLEVRGSQTHRLVANQVLHRMHTTA